MPNTQSLVPRRVLVAVDASPLAPRVVARAAALAANTNASVRLYHAIDIPPEFPPAAATHGHDALPAYMRAEATRRLEALALQLGALPHDIVVDASHRPAHAILDAAAAFDADLIVVGSHGYKVVDRLLGTTAADVVNLATRDVLVVHAVPRDDA